MKYALITLLLTLSSSPDWGFYGHRLINRQAVYSLPPELFGFFKKNIAYITDHAVDPDKRRYATKHEGFRHYIDIDVWDTIPFPSVPRRLDDALIKYSHYSIENETDTIAITGFRQMDSFYFSGNNFDYVLEYDSLKTLWRNHIMPVYYEDDWLLPLGTTTLRVEDHFSKEGILPYHLYTYKNTLTRAFADLNYPRILQVAAEMGHYIGDAHVPLHTTINYNGHLTDQVGIHAFWESRIPELFAEREYDFLVGKADYIDDPRSYFWDIIIASHSHLEDVLSIERTLKESFPEDQQYCYDERLDRTVRIQCPEYAAAYQERMQGMVEERMQKAIHAIASIWYTAWVDAGQPILDESAPTPERSEDFTSKKEVIDQARPH